MKNFRIMLFPDCVYACVISQGTIIRSGSQDATKSRISCDARCKVGDEVMKLSTLSENA